MNLPSWLRYFRHVLRLLVVLYLRTDLLQVHFHYFAKWEANSSARSPTEQRISQFLWPPSYSSSLSPALPIFQSFSVFTLPRPLRENLIMRKIPQLAMEKVHGGLHKSATKSLARCPSPEWGKCFFFGFYLRIIFQATVDFGSPCMYGRKGAKRNWFSIPFSPRPPSLFRARNISRLRGGSREQGT